MKFTSDSFVLILFILGMIYISCNKNLEGICFANQKCMNLDKEECLDNPYNNGKGCMWMDDPTPPPPAPNKNGICFANQKCMNLDKEECLDNPYNNGKGCMWMDDPTPPPPAPNTNG